jgi:hypothetical protein
MDVGSNAEVGVGRIKQTPHFHVTVVRLMRSFSAESTRRAHVITRD